MRRSPTPPRLLQGRPSPRRNTATRRLWRREEGRVAGLGPLGQEGRLRRWIGLCEGGVGMGEDQPEAI